MIDPTAFSIFGLDIRWYGIIYALGFFFGALIAVYFGKKRGISKDDVYDFFTYLIPGVVIGARLIHVLFEWNYYGAHLGEIIAVWNGGLSFHGGLLGALVVGGYYCKKRKIAPLDMADVLSFPLAIGLGFGRIGNFINQELYGTLTDLPWGVKFNGVEGTRHPVQIYSALKDFFIAGVIWQLWKIEKLPKGFIFFSFLCMYSFLRFFIEFYREWERPFLGLTYPQMVNVIIFFVSSYFLFKLYKSMKKQ